MASSNKQFPDTKIMTGKVRFSYANVFQAKAIDGGPAKYSISLLIPKSDKVTVAAVNKAIEAAKAQGKEKTWKGKMPPVLKLPLRDGDAEKPDNEEYEGMWFLGCNSSVKPGILGPDKLPITTEEGFYSGCYGRAVINFYPFDQKGNKGVAVGLNNLMKMEDGERLGGRDTAENDFASIEGEEDDLS